MTALLLIALASYQPFNLPFIYSGDQSGKGAVPVPSGCITAGNTPLDLSGNKQILFTMVDETGCTVWSDSFYTGNSSEVYGVYQVGDNAVITGSSSNQSTSEDALAFAVSETGQILWEVDLELPLQERFTSAAQGTNGQIVLAGSTNSDGAGGNDVLMVAVDENGTQQWRKTYGTTGEEAVYHISACTDGGYVLACQAMDWGAGLGDYWIIRTDSQGDTLWTGTYGGPQFDYPWRVLERDGFIYVAGSTLSYGEGSYDWWILKLNSSGTLVWERSWGFENTDTCMALEVTDAGVMVGGASEPVLNQFQATLVGFDTEGNVLSHWTYGPGMFRSISVVNTGCFLMGGTVYTADSDLWTLCVDSTGFAPEMGICGETIQEGITFSANPARGSSMVVSLPEGTERVFVYDISGRVTLGGTEAGETMEIDLTALPEGIYTLRTNSGESGTFAVLR